MRPSQKIPRWFCLVLVAILGHGIRVAGQRPSPAETGSTKPSPSPVKPETEINEGDIVRVNTTLVTVPVTVFDRKNRYLTDLPKQQFHVFENGVEQGLAYFAPVDKPFMVALLLDISDSTQEQLSLIQEAAIAFIDSLRPDDQVFVVAFDSRVRLLAQPQMKRRALRDAIRALQSGHGTSLYAVVDETIKEFPNAISGRKAMVLLTDGIDTTTPLTMATFKSSVERAEQSDVIIYSVQVNAPPEINAGDMGNTELKYRFPQSKPGPLVAAEYARASDYLHELANKTSGQLYAAADLKRLTQTFTKVADDLRRQYSLGYYPKTTPHAGETREIKVTVDQPHVTVRARSNYVCCRKTPDG